MAGPGAGQGKEARRPGTMLWITAVWGLCFLAIRLGLQDAPVLWFAALRALIAAAALLLVCLVQGRNLPRGLRTWTLITLMGVADVTVAFAAMFAGTARMAIGAAAVLANAQPLLIILPAWWVYGESLSARTVLGITVGFAGLLVVGPSGGGGSGAWLSLLGGRCWPGWPPSGNRHGDLRSRLDLLTAWTMLVPVIGIGVSLFLPGETPPPWAAAGIGLVLASLWLVLRRPRRRTGQGEGTKDSDAAGRAGR